MERCVHPFVLLLGKGPQRLLGNSRLDVTTRMKSLVYIFIINVMCSCFKCDEIFSGSRSILYSPEILQSRTIPSLNYFREITNKHLTRDRRAENDPLHHSNYFNTAKSSNLVKREDEYKNVLPELTSFHQNNHQGELTRLTRLKKTNFVDKHDHVLVTTDGGKNLSLGKIMIGFKQGRSSQKEFRKHRIVKREARKRDGNKHKGNKNRKSGSSSTTGSKHSKRDPITQNLHKYNQYMDIVLRRMNAMIQHKKMDPLKVNLYAGRPKEQTGGRSISDFSDKRKNSRDMSINFDEFDNNQFFIDSQQNNYQPGWDDTQVLNDFENLKGAATKNIYLNELNNENMSFRKIRGLLLQSVTNDSSIELLDRDDDSSETRAGRKRKQSSKKRRKGDETNLQSNKKKKKNKRKNSKPTRGVLIGLSTLRRDGDVQVIRKGKIRKVRAKFFLGPVTLHVFPKSRRSKDKEEKEDKLKPSATAVAEELKGVIEIRLKRGSSTRIRRLRVYPPSDIQVKARSGIFKSEGRQYSKVTPMATKRLRRIAAKVVRQTDRIEAKQLRGS